MQLNFILLTLSGSVSVRPNSKKIARFSPDYFEAEPEPDSDSDECRGRAWSRGRGRSRVDLGLDVPDENTGV